MIKAIVVIYLLIGLLITYISYRMNCKNIKLDIKFIMRATLVILLYPIIIVKFWLDDYIDRNFC